MNLCLMVGSLKRRCRGAAFMSGVTLYTEAHYVVVAVQVRVPHDPRSGPEVFVIRKSGQKQLILIAFGA